MSNIRALVGESVPITTQVHGTAGAVETPTSITSRSRSPAGVYAARTAPTQADSQTGQYSETFNTTGLAEGVWEVAHTVVLSTGEVQRVTHTVEVRQLAPNVNVTKINGVTIKGDGSANPFYV